MKTDVVGGRVGLPEEVLDRCQSGVRRWEVDPRHNPAPSVAAQGGTDVGVPPNDELSFSVRPWRGYNHQ